MVQLRSVSGSTQVQFSFSLSKNISGPPLEVLFLSSARFFGVIPQWGGVKPFFLALSENIRIRREHFCLPPSSQKVSQFPSPPQRKRLTFYPEKKSHPLSKKLSDCPPLPVGGPPFFLAFSKIFFPDTPLEGSSPLPATNAKPGGSRTRDDR